MNFFYRYKKYLLIIGFLAAIFIFAFIIYSLFFKPSIGPGPGDQFSTTTDPTGGLGFPQAGEGGQQVTDGTPGGAFPSQIEEVKEKVSPIANGGITKTSEITDTPSLGATLSSNGQDINFYDREDGKFYRINKDGDTTLLTDKVFYNVESVTWAPQKNKAIL